MEGGGSAPCTGGEVKVGGGGHARDRKQRTQCKFIRIWQVNTRWQQCCHAGGRGGAFRGVKVQCAGRRLGPVVGYSYRRWHKYGTSQNTLFSDANVSTFSIKDKRVSISFPRKSERKCQHTQLSFSIHLFIWANKASANTSRDSSRLVSSPHRLFSLHADVLVTFWVVFGL